jgi:tetratricopeptide (TPR) repeat protein
MQAHRVSAGQRNAEPADRRLREVLAVVLVLLGAMLLRDLYLFQYITRLPYHAVPILDAAYYDSWAQRVAAGRGYGAAPFYMAPLYPYVLALAYKLLGHNLTLVYVLQHTLGMMNLLMVYALGRRLFGHRSGLIAMGFMMLYGPLMYLESKLLTETLAIALNLTSLLLLIRALDRPSALRFLAAGLVMGLGVVCRPVAVITVVLTVLWLILRRANLRQSGFRLAYVAILLLGAVLVILPVTVRNYVIGKDFAVISTNAGMVFAQSNSQYAFGVSIPLPGFSSALTSQQQEETQKASAALGHPVSPSESSAYWLRFGMNFIREHPGRFLVLLGEKLIWSLHNRESACSYNVYLERQFVPVLNLLLMPFSVIAGMGIYGMALALRGGKKRDSEVMAIQVLSVFLGLLVFAFSSRYRVPAIPGLAVFAGFGLSQAVCHIRKRDIRAVGMAVVPVVAVSLVSLIPHPVPTLMSNDIANLGIISLDLGKPKEAIGYLNRAIEMYPNADLSHYAMGSALLKLGRTDDALKSYARALELNPDSECTCLAVGGVLAGRKQFDRAISYYSRAVKLNPRNAETHVNLGSIFAVQGKAGTAVREFREAIRIQPDLAAAHLALARMLYIVGELAGARDEAGLAERYGMEIPARIKRKLAAPGHVPRSKD